MRYNVTIATTAFELVTFDVDGASEEEAKATATDRYLKKRPRLRPFDIAVVKIVDIGPSPPGRRRRRKVRVGA